MPHHLRLAWFHAKRLGGIPTRGDRSFLISELVRRLERNEIGPDLHIMASGRTDGAGAQAMAKMSAMALAHHYGLRYVHVPFTAVAHPESMSEDQWGSTWEEKFNLGCGALHESQCRLPYVGIETFISTPSLWRKPCVLVAGHYTRFTDKAPQSYLAIRQKLRANYRPSTHRSRADTQLNICAHVRRGDVSLLDRETAHRGANLSALKTCLVQVQEVSRQARLPVRFRLFSQGDRTGLEDFEAMGWELHLDTPAVETFDELVDANVLVMGRSSFSFVAALLSQGICIYDSFARHPIPGWMQRDRQGRVDTIALRNALHRLTRQPSDGMAALPIIA